MGLKVGGAIRLDNCAAKGQTRSNNDFVQRHDSLVTGRKWKNEHIYKLIWVFHLLTEELQQTAVLTSKENANVQKGRFDNALEISL